MNHDTPPPSVHPAGEQPPIEKGTTPAVTTLDSWAGAIRVEWDTTAPLTPYGQLPFFIEYLKVAGLFDALVADCPLAYTSPAPVAATQAPLAASASAKDREAEDRPAKPLWCRLSIVRS
jgi:hypothetical protein